jgi:signal transduction histidine kinase
MGVDKTRASTTADDLRRRAEEQLKAKAPETHFYRTDFESERLLHELQVHQIELEMQNAELRQVRDELETALEKYTDLYDFAPVGYFTLGRDGAIHAVNLRGADLLATERTRLLGRRFGPFVADGARPHFSEFLEKVFAGNGKESCELALTRAGNSPFFVQIEAVDCGSGQECRVAVIDITDRKRAEVEIQRQASFPLMNPNPVLEMDANGKMTFCNPAAKKILENSGDNGRNPFIPHDLPVIFQKLRDEEAGQFFRGVEINGCYYEELIFIVPQFQSVRIYTMDITARKRAEEKLEILNTELAAANIELEAFNYSVSHDLRKPLTVINSYCQLILEMCGAILEGQCRDYVSEMYEGTLRMNRLIDTLLDFSRITRVEIHHDTVDLSAMAMEVAMGLKVTEPERRVTFRIAEGVVVDGDAGLLRVVLENLGGNAWKYTASQVEAVVEFGVTEIDGTPACFVRDNGAGFAMEHADKLFIPFRRLPGVEKFRGHGIGLATVDRIIKRHGGRVWAEGEPGKGACFWFTLSKDRVSP